MGLIRKALSIATVGLSDRLFEDDSKRGRTAKSEAKRGRTQKRRSATRSKPQARRKPQTRPKRQARLKAAPRRKQRARSEPVRPEPQALRTSAPATALAPGDATINELERLADLHSRGALTNEEFAVAKAKILGTSLTPREPDRDDAAFPAVEANVAAARRLADLAALDDASVTTLSSD